MHVLWMQQLRGHGARETMAEGKKAEWQRKCASILKVFFLSCPLVLFVLQNALLKFFPDHLAGRCSKTTSMDGFLQTQ